MEHFEQGAHGGFIQKGFRPIPPPPPPPSLSAAHDSWMTDADRMLCGDATQRIDDGPSDCEGPPKDHNRRKHPLGGMESVLSGSEEDLHLESINTFFERQGRLARPEGAMEPCQERLEDQGEVIREKELCSPGRQASGRYLPETITVFNSLAARSEAGLGSDATQTARGTININTMNKARADLETTPEGADGSSRAETNKLTNPETELLIKEDRLMSTGEHELRQSSRYRGVSDDFICLEDTLGSDQAQSLKMCKRWHDAEYEQPSLNMETLSSMVGVAVVDGLQKANINLLLPGLDPNSQHRNAAKDLSDYNRKRKKKKKRFSFRLEKRKPRGQLSTESEELPSAQRTGMDPCLSTNQSEVRGSEKTISGCVFAGSLPNTVVTQTSSFIDNPSDSLHPLTPLSDNQHRHVKDNPDSAPVSEQKYNTPRSTPNNISLHKSFSTSGPADDRPPSATVGANVGTHLQAQGASRQNKPTGPTLTPGSLTRASACERSVLSGDGSDAGHMGTLQQLYEKKHYFTNTSGQRGGKSDLYAAEVNTTTNGIHQDGDSNGPMEDMNQSDEKANREDSHLAGGTGFSGSRNPTECLRGAQHSQKLEIDGHKVTIPLSSTHPPRSTIVMIASDAQGMTKELETGLSSVVVQNPVEGHLSLDPVKVSPDAESITPNNQLVTITKVSVFSGNTSTQGIQPPVPQLSPVHSCDTSPFQEEISSNTAELTLSYGCLFSAEPSKKELTITDMSDNSPQVIDTDTRVTKDVERHETSQDISDVKCLIEGPPMMSETAEDVNKAPDSENKVFAMSSFWDEMEKLTIKDILGLRMTATTPPPQFLLPLAESEETDNNDTTDSGYFTTQFDDTKALSTIPDLEHVGSLASTHAPLSSPGIMWDVEPSQVTLGPGINCECTRLTSDPDKLQALLPSSSEERRHRQMFKNTSVHNLHAMGSEQFSRMQRIQTLAAVIPEESRSEKDWFTDVRTPFSDCGTDSGSSSLFTEGTPAEGYRISLTDIFRSLFGGKQSNPKPPDPEDKETYFSCGNTVPENYDQFFSEFELGSIFYPLLEADDHPKDELVPIFSRSRSASRYLQYPEAYDHFLSSSSSDDDSSAESEEEGEGPIRVVTRFSHRAAKSPTSTDIYENFFADLDIRNSLFWNTTFSLRNIRFTGPLSKRQQRSGPLTPLDRGSVQRPRQVFSINALGSQDSLAYDPGLYHFEERIYRQPNPFSLDDLQLAVSHQSLGASLVPLRQSDMCLVCIAFASWVLKSANPDVGDAWKAVVLANISALSAIGYLRKYMRERSLAHPATRSSTL